MKQSSIEWLMEIDKSRAITIEEWEQAKAMHKEEIETTFEEGMFHHINGMTPKEYYDTTFNTKEK